MYGVGVGMGITGTGKSYTVPAKRGNTSPGDKYGHHSTGIQAYGPCWET